jgi:hypothetical protein
MFWLYLVIVLSEQVIELDDLLVKNVVKKFELVTVKFKLAIIKLKQVIKLVINKHKKVIKFDLIK